MNRGVFWMLFKRTSWILGEEFVPSGSTDEWGGQQWPSAGGIRWWREDGVCCTVSLHGSKLLSASYREVNVGKIGPVKDGRAFRCDISDPEFLSKFDEFVTFARDRWKVDLQEPVGGGEGGREPW
jgi:hypothetical protein